MSDGNSSGKYGINITYIVAIGLVIAVLGILLFAGTRTLTRTESLLLGILLSTASILASWLTTHLYSQSSLQDAIKEATVSNTENIRSMGVRAGEKVLNLSNELERLVDALSTALEEANDSEQPTMLLRERVLSAVHNIVTLKSMNDTFLSDWRGVIGEEIERQHILENQIESLTNELENQKRERDLLRSELIPPEDFAAVQSRIAETEHRLTEKIMALPFKIHAKPVKPRKEERKIHCTSCDAQLGIRLRIQKGAKKLVKCDSCEGYTKVTVIEDGGLKILPIQMYDFHGKCPVCNTDINEQLPDYPSAVIFPTCSSCELKLSLSKTATDANLRIPNFSPKALSDKMIEEVKTRLPKRPWPTHVHKSIANELNISNSLVSKIIGLLIEQGYFPLEEEHSKPNQEEH